MRVTHFTCFTSTKVPAEAAAARGAKLLRPPRGGGGSSASSISHAAHSSGVSICTFVLVMQVNCALEGDGVLLQASTFVYFCTKAPVVLVNQVLFLNRVPARLRAMACSSIDTRASRSSASRLWHSFSSACSTAINALLRRH
jgi:hypothetical protein